MGPTCLLHNTNCEPVLQIAHKMVWTKVINVLLFEAVPYVSAFVQHKYGFLTLLCILFQHAPLLL